MPYWLDGALGTELERLGVPTPAPWWSGWAVAHRPDVVASIHAAYAAAGARIHTAATFRTAPASAGPRSAAWTATAVGLARRSVPADHEIAGSVAPIHDCWRPDLSPDDAYARHVRFAATLADLGVDRLLVETFAHVGEAIAATRAAVRTGLPVWTALTPGWRGDLLAPAALAAGARAVADAGASIVLVNCLPAERAEPWVEALAATGIPWGVYANGGVTQRADGPASYAAHARRWFAAGAEVIGGCCGTTPEHLRASIERILSFSSHGPEIA